MRIGEIAARAGMSTRMLRHYDRIGLVTPSGRTAGGYREYTEEDVRRLLHVESLRSLGLSLAQAGRALDDADFEPAGLVADLVARTRERIALETELLRRLEDVQRAGAGDWTDVLALTALIRDLDSRDASQRQRSALASGSTGRPPAAILTRSLLDEADANVAGALRWALQRADDALEALRPGLQDPDPATRRRAAETLAEFGTDDAGAVLAVALADDDPVVRRTAALGVGPLGDRRAVPTLLALIVAGDHDVEAAEALGAIAARHRIADAIVAALDAELDREGATAEVRSRLVQALAEIPSPAAHRLAASLVEDPALPVAMAARYVERRLGGRSG